MDLLEIFEDDDGDILEFINYQRQVHTIRIRTNHIFFEDYTDFLVQLTYSTIHDKCGQFVCNRTKCKCGY